MVSCASRLRRACTRLRIGNEAQEVQVASWRPLEMPGLCSQGADVSEHKTWMNKGSHSKSVNRHTGWADGHVCWRQSCNAYAPGRADGLCGLWRQSRAGGCGYLRHFSPAAVWCHHFSPALKSQAAEQLISRPDVYRGPGALFEVSCRCHSKIAWSASQGNVFILNASFIWTSANRWRWFIVWLVGRARYSQACTRLGVDLHTSASQGQKCMWSIRQIWGVGINAFEYHPYPSLFAIYFE